MEMHGNSTGTVVSVCDFVGPILDSPSSAPQSVQLVPLPHTEVHSSFHFTSSLLHCIWFHEVCFLLVHFILSLSLPLSLPLPLSLSPPATLLSEAIVSYLGTPLTMNTYAPSQPYEHLSQKEELREKSSVQEIVFPTPIFPKQIKFIGKVRRNVAWLIFEFCFVCGNIYFINRHL